MGSRYEQGGKVVIGGENYDTVTTLLHPESGPLVDCPLIARPGPKSVPEYSDRTAGAGVIDFDPRNLRQRAVGVAWPVARFANCCKLLATGSIVPESKSTLMV